MSAKLRHLWSRNMLGTDSAALQDLAALEYSPTAGEGSGVVRMHAYDADSLDPKAWDEAMLN